MAMRRSPVLDYQYLYYQTLPRRKKREPNGSLTPESVDEKLSRLEEDKENLTVQVGVLTEQVEFQGHKISDLQCNLEEKRHSLKSTETILQSELMTRTSLETHKLDMMAEISSLKIKLASCEKDKRELEERMRYAQRHISDLEAKLNFRDNEITELRNRLLRNGLLGSPASPPPDYSNGDIAKEKTLEKERTLERLKRKQTEVEKLKKAVDCLMLSNDEKDKRIDEMRRGLRRYKNVEEAIIQTQGRRALEDLLSMDDEIASNNSNPTSFGSDHTNKDNHYQGNYRNDINPHPRHPMPTPTATSTPVSAYGDNKHHNSGSSTVSTILDPNHPTPAKRTPIRSNSCEEIAPPKTPPSSKRNNIHGTYGTLPPRPSRAKDEEKRGRGFGKTLLRIRSGKRSSSAPNLGAVPSENGDDDRLYLNGGSTVPTEMKKKRGLRRLFGRIKRSGSQDLEQERNEEFKRGGVRATAGPRLGWSREARVTEELSVPFSRWDGDKVTSWLHEIGLNMYVTDCKRWVRNGDMLLRASPHDIDKELNMKNPLHKKKLQLALQAVSSQASDGLGALDHNWVTRWLDDIGLPQYKDYFYDARVDGRMLHYLTVEDLLALKVMNELHHGSIRRGIQVLRGNNFNPACLRRRPLPEEHTEKMQNISEQVIFWTNHRVMEWLRTIDLSEYAPNLRGSGVHGALMVYEARFNSELFSQLLSIPQHKTLLRRHLNSHFITLIGNETQHKKRECEAAAGYIPLTPSAKVKGKKFGIFGHRRSRSESESDGLICPLDVTAPSLENGFSRSKPPTGKFNSLDDHKAARRIGAVSKEINSLTNMLSRETFERDVPQSTV